MKTIGQDFYKKLVDAICRIYGANIVSIIMYGSVARNTAEEDSDIDIALIIHKDNESMHDQLLDAMVDLDLEYGQVISPSLIEKERFDQWKKVLPYYRNIEKEGITLWTAA